MRPRRARLAEIGRSGRNLCFPRPETVKWCGKGERDAVAGRMVVGSAPGISRLSSEVACEGPLLSDNHPRSGPGSAIESACVARRRAETAQRRAPFGSGIGRIFFGAAGLRMRRRGTRGGDDPAALSYVCTARLRLLGGDAKTPAEYSPFNFRGLLPCDSP
ncbi:hypothetical protein SRO_7207 [Streptomyces rochei]|nr:hypothetical protein SRO_7207 [Streptomyces rochei]